VSVAQHPNIANMAISCGEDRLIKVWSLNDGICQRSILCRSKPLDVAFSGDGQFIVSAHYDGSLHVFDASTGSEVQHIERVHIRESGPCLAVVPTAMPFKMVSVGRDSIVCITDVYLGEVRKTLATRYRYLVRTDFIAIIYAIASRMSYGGQILLQVMQRFEHPEVLHIAHQRCKPAVAPDDSVILVGSSSGVLVLLDVKSGAVAGTLACHGSPVTGVAWNVQSEDCRAVAASADKTGDVVFWQAET
jgi:WD40 repeat protein